jgi:predicted TIM-barrel fold metal-dependent hydrolase
MSDRIIDGCLHHHWAAQQDVMQYMSRGWQEYLNQSVNVPGGSGMPLPILPLFPYYRPDGDKLPGTAPAAGPPGSDFELLREQALDAAAVERAVLSHDQGMFAPCVPNPHLARAVVSAINRWTAEHWLGRDDRLYALALVPTQTPEDAVAEIRRVANDPRIVGILISANGLSKTFGHPIYHPIYQAAAEHDLPIVIHVGGEAPSEVLSHTAAGGPLGTYGEYAIFRPQPLMTHVVSMIIQGVFEKHPNLKLLLMGGGVAWLPALLWRFDTEYRAYRREAPWIKRMPSEIFRDHVRISTYPLDVSPDPSQLVAALNTVEQVEDMLVFASGYPDWDADTPGDVADRIPSAWHEKVFHQNALDLFRWDRPSALQPSGDARVGVMD